MEFCRKIHKRESSLQKNTQNSLKEHTFYLFENSNKNEEIFFQKIKKKKSKNSNKTFTMTLENSCSLNNKGSKEKILLLFIK